MTRRETIDALLAAGLPLSTVTGSDREIAVVKYERELTREEQARAASILARFDPDAPDPAETRRARLKELRQRGPAKWSEKERLEILAILVEIVGGG